ncbi:MAG: hypothetical protein ACK5R0_20740 [Bacteroidota bacterium]|nr:hypothetical protein [Cytophagales bacterium]
MITLRQKVRFDAAVVFCQIVCPSADSQEKVRSFVAKRTFAFVHVADEKFITRELKVRAFPKNIFLNKNGHVYKVEDGIPCLVDGQRKPKMGDRKEFELILDHLLVANGPRR